MKIGINSSLWTTRVTEEHLPLLEKFKNMGYDGVELSIFDVDPAYCRNIGSKIKDLGLEMTSITSMTPNTNPVNPDPKIRSAALDHLKGIIESVAELETPILGGPFHSCFKEFTKAKPSQDEMKWTAEVMHAAAEYGEKYGITLAPEALNRFECYLINTAEQARELVRLTDHSNFGYHFDTHHASIEEKNSADAIVKSAKEIKYIHISENDRGTPGTGQVHWDPIFKAIKEINYDDWLVIEAFVSTIPNFSEHINVWRDYSPQEEIYTEGYTFIKKMLR